MSRIELGDYCGRCLAWIWGSGCACGRFKNGVNTELCSTQLEPAGQDAREEKAR